jgi:hypothetical protein
MKQKNLLPFLALIGCAQAFAAQPSQWKHTVMVYFLGAAMDGNAAIGNLAADVDVPFSDIADKLEFGAMGYYRAEKDQLSFGLDVIYMGLGGTALNGLAEVDFDQWMVEGTAGWRATDVFEVFAGVRYNDVAAEIAGRGPRAMKLSKSQGWYDPIVGSRLWLPLSGKLSCLARGDIGGFGVGSDLTWQLGAYLRYATSKSSSLLLGYRYLDIDYEDGAGASRFVYNVTIQGPALGFSWQF